MLNEDIHCRIYWYDMFIEEIDSEVVDGLPTKGVVIDAEAVRMIDVPGGTGN